MASPTIHVLLDSDLLRRLDADPQVRTAGRSAVVRSALRLYLLAKARCATDRALLDAYGGRGDVLFSEMEDLLEVQAWSAE